MPRNYLIYCISFLIFSFASFANAENLDYCAKTTLTETAKTTTAPTSEKTTTTQNEEQKLPKIGNFGLPASQQLGPLISFGRNIIDKGQTQVFLGGLDFIGSDKHLLDIAPAIFHQITDNLSLGFSPSIAADYKSKETHSSGLGDALVQLEYVTYLKDTSTFSDQATIVTYASIPTGSTQKEPNTGLGSPSFFLGGTFTRAYVEWYGFISDGVVATTPENGVKPGNQFLYQCAIGKNLHTVPSKYIFAALLEVDGTYTEKTQTHGLSDPNSGGNVIYVTPSIWFSTQKLILQLGVGFPVTQNLFGDQIENHYLVAGNIAWTF